MKFLKILLILLILTAIAGGCFLAYTLLTKEDEEENLEGAKEPEIISSDPLFSVRDYPRFDASLATQPLATAFISNFTGVEFTDEEIGYTNTHPSYLKLIDGETDIIIVTEPSEEELEVAEEKGIELEVIPVVKEGFVFFVNEDNPVDNLTLEEVQKIYAGEITNWKEVGGDDEEIRPIQRPVNSGSQTGMLSMVMKDKELLRPTTTNIAESMFDIINIVATYDNGLNTIGYSYYYFTTVMYDTTENSGVTGALKLLSIDNVKPNNTTIQNGSYPLVTSYNIVINKAEPKDSDVRKLIDAMLSPRGQKVAEDAGYVRIK